METLDKDQNNESSVESSKSTNNMISQLEQANEDYIKQILSNAKAETDTDGLIRDTAETARRIFKYRIKENSLTIFLFFYVTALTCFLLHGFVQFIRAVIEVNSTYVQPDLVMVLVPIISIIIFMISTLKDYWNYHKRKYYFVILIIVSIVAMVLRINYYVFYSVLMPLLIKIPPREAVTKEMLVFLFQLCTFVPTAAITFFITKGLFTSCFCPTAKQAILNFKLNKFVDFRKNKKYSYDMHFIRKLYDGSIYVVREMDRFLHTLINGASGTGKTSSTMMVRIADDLDKRCLNEDMQKVKMLKLLKSGKVYMKENFTDEDFTVNKLAPKPGYENEFDKICKKHRLCGITVVAPNYGLTDDLYNLCKVRGIKCNRIDPIPLEDGTYKEGYIGFNPLYISPLIPEWFIRKEVIKRATLFADVLQAVNELKGKGDPYFTSLNRSITTAVTICLCITFPMINKRQPTPADVQSVVNDFSRIKPYYEKLRVIDTDNSLEFVTDFIKNDMLGEGKDKMTEQSRGLRTIMNEFLTNPLIKKTLCTENTIDMDEMLRNGEVTVINYALELGNTDSIGFGLFFVLSFIDAVLRRPGTENTRIPHFFDIDELPVLLHPNYERALSLFRQYRCGFTGCIQSLDQMDKSETTKFLKKIVMGGCAHHILFGRCGISEMEEYSKLAGKEYRTQETFSISETALSLENTSSSFSTRTTEQLEDVIQGTALRNNDFQEVTIFSVVSGNLVPPFQGKLSFLKKEKKLKIKRVHVDWSSLYEKCFSLTSQAIEDVKFDESYTTSEQTKSTINTTPQGSSILQEKGIDLDDLELENDTLTAQDMDSDPILSSGLVENINILANTKSKLAKTSENTSKAPLLTDEDNDGGIEL